MPKQTTVVEFDDKEIREILKEKAKQSLGNSIQGGVTIEFPELGVDGADKVRSLSCRVIFNGKPA